MKVRLGYVSLPLTINTTSSKTITYTRYKETENGFDKINSLIEENLDSLLKILEYNYKNNIHFYRMTSNLIPLATLEEVKFDYIYPYIDKYKNIGKYANIHSIRIDMHPDQFCVLNSTNPKIVKNSINILEYSKKLLDAFDFNSPKIILHVGSSQGGKKKSLSRFRNNFRKLDKNIQDKIVLENDDKVFSVTDVLGLSKELNIPMVLDYHHYLCNNNGEKIEDLLQEIFNTWKDEVYPPKIHFSSPKSKLKKEFRSHHDYINADEFIRFVELAKSYTNELDIMIEAKAKDFALFKLVRELKYLTNYKFIDDTTFVITDEK